jgi:predicted metal-dependent peptidase
MSYDRAARDNLESAISSLMLLYPIYGTVFLYLNKIERKDMPTMAVGTTRRVDLALYYNPDFLKKMTATQLRAVLKHEALHILLHHISRNQYFGYNMKGFNYAADMAINCHIEGLPEGCLYPKTFGLQDNESSEWYYEKLKKEQEEKGEDALDGKGDLADDHSMWGDCDDDIIKEKVRNIAEQAIKAQEKSGWGDVSGNLAQQIIAANKPVVNWKREVRYFINQIIMMGKRSTRMRPNRRFGYSNPGAKRDYISKILVGIDTSGSVSDQELQYFLQEINGMISHVKVDLVQFDHGLTTQPTPFESKLRKLEVKGRGGTDFSAPIKLADDMKYDGLIIFTDCCAPFPPKPKCRILWAACKQNESHLSQAPYGRKVVIEQKSN